MRKTLLALLYLSAIVVGLSIVFYVVNGARNGNHPSSLEIDLARPGAMEAVARENPAHYAKIVRIIAEVGRRQDDAVPRWMKTEFNADMVVYSNLLMTSNPTRRQLSFTLDKTHYRIIVLDLLKPQLEPAR